MPNPVPLRTAPLPVRSTRPWEGALDVVSVLAVVAAVGGSDRAPLGGLVTLAVAAGCLAARRRTPRVAWTVATTAAAVAGFVWPEATWLVLALWVMAQVCLFSLALRDGRRVATAAAVLLTTTLVVQSVVAQANSVVDLLSFAVVTWTAAVLGAGLAVRAQHEHVAALEAKNRAEAADRAHEVDRRLTQERLLIARDLHDAVGHTLAAIALHAGAAEQNIRSAPDDSVASLGAIRTAARTAVGEMQQIVRLLRDEGDPRVDQDRVVPGMAAVPDLVRTVRASGLRVSYSEQITSSGLPQAVDVTVFRILQEGLTNALRYGDGTVELSVVQHERTVTVRVHNPRGTQLHDPERTGFGLRGMHERVVAAGGRLSVEDTAQGFEVFASLPVESTRRPA